MIDWFVFNDTFSTIVLFSGSQFILVVNLTCPETDHW